MLYFCYGDLWNVQFWGTSITGLYIKWNCGLLWIYLKPLINGKLHEWNFYRIVGKLGLLYFYVKIKHVSRCEFCDFIMYYNICLPLFKFDMNCNRKIQIVVLNYCCLRIISWRKLAQLSFFIFKGYYRFFFKKMDKISNAMEQLIVLNNENVYCLFIYIFSCIV